MNPKGLTNSFKDLSSLCQDRSSAIVKFARISFQANKKNSQLSKIEPFILLIEYFQLIAQALLFNSAFYTETILNNSIFLKKLVGFLHLMNPGYLLLSSEVEDTTIEITFFGLLCYIILKLLVLAYILYLVFANVQGNNLVIYVWKFIFKVQGRVLYFFVTSFCVSILSIVSEDKIETSMVGKEIIMGFSVLIFTIEYFSSLILQSFFCYVFPTKNALSSKNNVVELINLTQKCLFQILQLALSTSLSKSPWVFPLMCVMFGVIRDTYYFKTLPLYKIKPLLFQGVLLAVITSLNLSYFTQVIFNPSNNDDVMMNFILVLWMIIALLAARVYYTYLYKLIAKLLTTNKSNSPDLLVHRVTLIKQLRKTIQKPTNPTAYYNWPYFLNLTIEANLSRNLNITLPELALDGAVGKNHKSLENQIFINYLEGVSARFPKDTLIRLYLTYFYAKKTKHFGKAMETILKLKKHLWPKTVLNAHLLVFEVQDVVDKEYRSEDNAINLAQYVKSQAYVADLKSEMFEQADLQIKVCQEILEDSSDLTKILEYGRSISHYRRKIQMKIKHVFETIPDYYIEPLMLCSEYHLKLNHSGEESLKYYKAHSQRYKRYEKYFRNETMLPQNLYQSGIAFFIFSAQKEDIGKIYFANIYAKNLHGGHPYSFLGTRLRDRASPNLKGNNALELCNKVERAYAYDKEGFVVEVEFYINIIPFMTEDLYFACIVRPVISNKDYLLVHENGDIEGASQSLSERLNANLAPNLSSSRGILNISVLSKELSRINEVFNIIKYSKKEDESGQVRFNNQEEEEAEQQDRKESGYDITKKIHTIYSTEGGEIVLKSLEEKGDKSAYDIFTYRCNVSNIFFGDQRYRIFILERLQEQRGQLSQDKDDQNKEDVKLFFRDQEEKEVRKEKGEKKNVIELNDSADFQSEEEKPGGETIFKTNHLEKNLTLFGQISNPMPTFEGNLLSPATSSRYETTQEVPLLLGKQQKKSIFNQYLYLGSYSEENETGDGKEELAWKPKASLTSQKIRNTQINNIQKVVNAALETHFHPKTFKAVYILFYLALIGTFLSQFALKLTIDATVSDLKIKNDLLRANDLITYKVALLNRMFGTMAGYKSRAILANSPTSNDARIFSYANSVKETLKQITVANQKVVDLIGFLDESSREMFFENNVRVFDTYFGNPEQRYMNLTNLQAMSRIVETGFEGADNILVNYDQAWEKLLLVSRNSLNDIMVVREEISTYFSESLADEVDQTLIIIDLYLFPTIFSLLVLVSVLGAIIWQQYVQEKNNMIAFVKLNSRNVKNALEKIFHFKSKLDEEKNYGNKQDSYNNSNERRRVKEKDSRVDVILKTPNDMGIKKKYMFYIIKLVLLVLILIGSLIWNSAFIKSSIRSLYKRQTQSHFADQIRTNLNMDIAISALFLNTNGTAFMRNIPSEEAAIIAMQDLDYFKQKAVVMLMNEDGNYDPIIQTILFETACQVLTGQPVLTCYSVENQGIKSGLVYLFASIQEFLQQRCQTYMKSNKSLESISTAYNLNNGGFSGAAILGIAETELIAELMDKGFQNGLIDVKDQGILFVVSLCTAVTVICILTWVYVLRKLRDTDIAFKKALRVFPADVIFSSFLLKSYLLKTTHNTLDSIRNYI